MFRVRRKGGDEKKEGQAGEKDAKATETEKERKKDFKPSEGRRRRR